MFLTLVLATLAGFGVPEGSNQGRAPAIAPVEAEQREIAALVASLIEIEAPDFGFAPTGMLSTFAPVPRSARFEGGILGVDPGLATHPAFRRLVDLGPRALPVLLATLDDATPTRRVQESGHGSMWYAREVPGNPANAREAAIRAAQPELFPAESSPRDEDRVRRHALTRGDVAFAAIGQIVNRPYRAVRYQPSFCLVVSSPTHDPSIAAAVRALWASDDASRTLRESLLADYAASGSTTIDGEFDRDSWQSGLDAAMRLAWYFPSETGELLARDIDADKKNPEILCGAVACGRDPRVRAAVVRAVERDAWGNVLAAVLDEEFARERGDFVVEHALAVVRRLPADFGTLDHPIRDVLRLLAEHLPDRARPVYAAFLEVDSSARRRIVAHALRAQPRRIAWAPEVLAPLLRDESDTGYQLGPEHARRPLLVRDEVAQAIAFHLDVAPIPLEADRAAVDARIAALERRLAGGSPEPDAEPPNSFDLAALPSLAVVRTVQTAVPVGRLSPASDRETLVGLVGSGAPPRFALDILTLDATSGVPRSRRRLDEWQGGVSVVVPFDGARLHAYHGYEGGHVLVHDLARGGEPARYATPFHKGVRPDDPLQVRNLRDMAVSGDRRWLFAATGDGALHVVETATGAHAVVATAPTAQPEGARLGPTTLVPVEGTNRVLLERAWGPDPLQRWDQDARRLEELADVPARGWTRAAGAFAVNQLNGSCSVWDLEASSQFDLHGIASPAPGSEARTAVEFDVARSRVFVVDSRGGFVFDLVARRPVARFDAPAPDRLAGLVVSRDGSTFFVASRASDARDGGVDEPVRITLYDTKLVR